MSIEAGIQLHLPSYQNHAMPELLQIARTAGAAGFDQIWVTDNVECRNVFVTLAALAPVTPAKLGTAIMAQYFRSPVEAMTAIMPVCELTAGRELCIGLGVGNSSTRELIAMPRPIAFMRQTASCLKLLAAGEPVAVDDYPLIRDYFNFAPGASLEILGRPTGAVSIYGGGNGPQGLALAGQVMDGLIYGWTTLPDATLGLLTGKLAIANEAAAAAGRLETFCRVTELKISIAPRHAAARQYVRDNPSCARRTAGLRRRGYVDDQIASLGIDPASLTELQTVMGQQGRYADFSPLVTDEMIDASYVAGDPAYCRERITEIAKMWRGQGFHQVIFSELGPNEPEAIELIAEHLIPLLR